MGFAPSCAFSVSFTQIPFLVTPRISRSRTLGCSVLRVFGVSRSDLLVGRVSKQPVKWGSRQAVRFRCLLVRAQHRSTASRPRRLPTSTKSRKTAADSVRDIMVGLFLNPRRLGTNAATHGPFRTGVGIGSRKKIFFLSKQSMLT